MNRLQRNSMAVRFTFIGLVGLTAVIALAQSPSDEFAMPPEAGAEEGFDFGDGGLDALGIGGGEGEVVSTSAVFTPPKADGSSEIFVTANMQPGWHIYSTTQPKGGPIRTEIKLKLPPGVKQTGPFQATSEPHRAKEPAFDNLMVETFDETVTWRAPLMIDRGALVKGVDLKTLKIPGAVYAQACSTACMMPQDYSFTATLGESQQPAAVQVSKIIEPTEKVEKPKAADLKKLSKVIGLAFLGGIILNLMPCVLPVISLKLFSFIQQGGESRGRVFVLNLWYTLGLLLVFLVLASLAATVGLTWGEQFTLPWFKVAMTSLVFVMALSFLGVWDIPIPGFVGSGRAGQLQTKEGWQGALAKGMFTTILATPCSGPFLGPVFGFLLNQPPYMAYVVFGSVGLGMASPYLVIGAFPALIKFLPKPGEWMVTLEQIMGFLLLGTVVYLFWTMGAEYFVPTLALLVGLWFACWLIGRAHPGKRLAAWLGGATVAAVIGLGAFTLLFSESIVPWTPFSPVTLAAARAEGKTVMVDFTAHWCPTCQLNSKWAIETQDVADLLKKNGVVPLLADWTDYSPVIKKTLNDLGRDSIPILAIWPAGASDDEVIILDDVITEGQLLEALQKAGPSKDVPEK